MSDHKQIVLEFIQKIRQRIPLNFTVLVREKTVSLLSEKFHVVFYHPQSVRLSNEIIRRTIHIDYDIVISSSEKLLARLESIFGFGNRIYARDTVVARVDKKVALEFQEEHHLQLALPGKYRYGLYRQGELVSIAVFSGGRKMNDTPLDYRSFELLRFCHKGSDIVIGGLSKLIKAFRKDFKPGDIMTYADLDWCQDSTLEKIGFIPVQRTPPQLILVREGIRVFGKNIVVKDQKNDYWVENNGSLKLKMIF
ncbi:hypothetical protein FAZ19_00685 [Sphingobacterium alkalisoli]|uniref:Uncharacterized protein n=2 Tax=Sphingobacterium TaxID=28453 RepID=A0A4U0P4E2_9SPHI|nr:MULTISPECIES: hypothetical protein [Sphingobacterium]TJY67815.1 hypothetical protein FAZ19_00685 [Sphingobacterium alkalisoli]TJZ62227.1 hypothetical protein FAZ15_06905 [Sphingobacterium olei]GGH11188.1 hypothetical protein GCM10011418_09900 [Sphingobacterium alkalisoli]